MSGTGITGTGIVYVVDDDNVVRASLAMLIETVGLEVRSYGSSREFLDDPHRHECDCLVLDLRMPGMSGLELQSRLGSGFAAPIIFVSGHADGPTAVQAMRDGAVDFLQKPFNDQALLDRIALALERSRQRRKEVERRVLLGATDPAWCGTPPGAIAPFGSLYLQPLE